MKKIVVTGSNGYIGRHVVKALLNMGAEVIALDIENSNVDERATYLKYDVFNSEENAYEMLGYPDVCLHLAWKDGFVHNSISHIDYLPAHYHFLRNLLEGGLKHVAVMGSMHEVGYFEGAISEGTLTNPISLYGIAKNTLRQLMQAYQLNEEFVFQWLRGYYILGDDLMNNSVFSKILQKAGENERAFPFTSGLNKYDFISIESLALQIALSVLQENINGVINCCSGKPVSLKDKVEEFIKERELNISLEYGAFPDRAYDSPVVYGENKKIKMIIENALIDECFDESQKKSIQKLLEELG
ncbi:MAG: NAD-dependent epimerase/dehydratase family protein [Eubacteriaceae bacterium]